MLQFYTCLFGPALKKDPLQQKLATKTASIILVSLIIF